MQYQDSIIFIIAKANQKVHGIFKSMFQKFGLTPMQALVLSALYQEDGISAGEVGRRLVLDSATLSGVLERMTESGWIVKRTTDEDRRIVNLYLTDKAKEIKAPLLRDVKVLNSRVLSSFRVEERLLLERMLKDLTK